MKIRILVALLLLATGSCGFFAIRSALSLEVRDVRLQLKSEAGTCKFTPLERHYAKRGDIIHWVVKPEDSSCNDKKIGIAHGPEDFTTCPPNPQRVGSPFQVCDEPTNTGQDLKEKHLYCRMDAFVDKGCYKYTISGDVPYDPEIEIGGPPNSVAGLLRWLLSLFGQSSAPR